MIDLSWCDQMLSLAMSFKLVVVISFALILDFLLGEPSKFHPLVGFGNIANWLEKRANLKSHHHNRQIIIGAVCWTMLIAPLPLFIYTIHSYLSPLVQLLLEAVLLYTVIGLSSLKQHAMQIFIPLKNNDMALARHFTGYLVSRDTRELTQQQMARATVESMLENGHDAVIASLFYYAIGGIELALVHRLANTLDAMWGYKNERFLYFGRFAARMDDVLGFVSAKVSALCYAVQGNIVESLKNAAIQGRRYKSHNGGWAMAAGATVLNVTLGGSAIYHGKETVSTTLGAGNPVAGEDIKRSVLLVERAALILLTVIFIVQFTNVFSASL